MGEYKRSIPVLYYTSKDSTHKYVYPFTRSLIGTVWHTPEQLERCEFHHIHEPDAIKFCARRADLPVEMIQQLLVALEQNGGGANLDTANSPLGTLTFETLKDGSPWAFHIHSVGYSIMFIFATSYISMTSVMGWLANILGKTVYIMNYIFIHQ